MVDTIVNVSSVGGRIGLPVLSAYHGTKFALEGLSESMSYELEPFGIRVVLIEPGVISICPLKDRNFSLFVMGGSRRSTIR